jgi:hypothetical protein
MEVTSSAIATDFGIVELSKPLVPALMSCGPAILRFDPMQEEFGGSRGSVFLLGTEDRARSGQGVILGRN